MSHSSPEHVYGYTNPTINYCYEEPARYIADYPDSDLSDRSHAITPSNGTTEIYGRNSYIPPPIPQELYPKNMYISPQNYYYETIPHVNPQMRRPGVPVVYRRNIPMVDERGRYFTPPLDDGFREHEGFSSPQISTVRRQSAPQTAVTHMAPRIGRRPPVAVRTPRYFKRPMTNVYKKPSTLCLPVSCQRDPAVYRRNRKHPEETMYHEHVHAQQPMVKQLVRRHSVPVQVPIPELDCEKELHMTQSDVDAVLARYDTIFEGTSDKCESVSSKSSRINKLLPKVPSSIKKEHEKTKKYTKKSSSTKINAKKQKASKTANSEPLQVEEMTTEVLDSMLSELMNSGGDNKLGQNSPQARKSTTGTVKNCEIEITTDSNKNVQENQSPYYQSYNYQDISKNLSKSQINNFQNCNTNNSVFAPSIPKISNANVNTNIILPEKVKSSVCDSHISDENGVMELHRSKSYIVNLIDRALSKELGTIPDEVYSPPPKEVNPIHPQQAVGTLKKHDRRCNNGLCVEITQTLTDSITSNATAPADNEIKHELSCTCKVQDEPVYIKQLQQLRWGHLKHIQMEVRRLEDLERFLDSYNSQR